tara:strand:- start:334 stop:1383 length:1050 start_codon:yes stop_codon:yes gene_type:complete
MAFAPTNKALLAGGIRDTGVKAGLQKFIPEVWGESIKDYMEKKLVVGGMARDLSAMVAGGGDIIHLPQHDEIVAGALYGTDSGALSTELTFAGSGTAGGEYQLLVNQSAVAATAISDLVQAQSSYELMNIYTQKLGYALAKNIELYIMTELIKNATYNYDGTDADGADGAAAANSITFTGADSYNITSVVGVPNMLQAILEADGSVDDYYMILPPATYASLWKLTEFVKFDGVGNSFGSEVPNVSGYVGKLAGVNVVVSNCFTTIAGVATSAPVYNSANARFGEADHLAGFVVHNDAINVAYAAGMKARVQSDYSLESLSTRYVADSVYGCAITGNAGTNKKVFSLTDA